MRFLIPLLFAISCLAQNEPAILQSTSPLRVGLAGYWRLEESSGTRYDRSKNGKALTSNNSVGQGSGVSSYTGNCATFVAASSQYLSGSTTDFQMGTLWTLAFWFKQTTTNTTQIYVSRDNGSTIREWVAYWNSASPTAPGFAIGDGASTVDANQWATNVSNSAWHFMVCGRSNSTTFISIDNAPILSKSFSLTPGTTAQPFYVGRYGSGLYLNGSMDEIGIWNRVLTSGERTQLYNSGSGTHFPWAHP